MLAEVVPFDATEGDNAEVVDQAAERLAGLAAGLTVDAVVHTEVLTGPAVPALCTFAQQQEMDVLVVGRRGRGRSTGVIGSVSTHIVGNSPLPVLVIGPHP